MKIKLVRPSSAGTVDEELAGIWDLAGQ